MSVCVAMPLTDRKTNSYNELINAVARVTNGMTEIN